MRYLFSITLFLLANVANAQVKLLTLNELESRVAKGGDTTYVINFWATWCGPCVEELPSFEKLQADNKNKPLKVILMSLDFKSKMQTEVIPFVKKQKLQTEVFVVNEKDQQDFIERVDARWSGALPATLFINKTKKVKAFYEQPFANYKELTDKIESLNLTQTKK